MRYLLTDESGVIVEDWGLSLVVNVGCPHTYDIEWKQLDTIHQYLVWMDQLSEKSWITPEQLNRFTQVVFQHNGWDSRA